MPVKKIINNGVFIANLAPLIDTPEAKALATAAQAHAKILDGLGITADTDEFEGCEQAQFLVACINGSEDPHAPESGDKMNAWTAVIWKAIADLAAGNMSEE